MKHHLLKFDTHADYENYMNSGDAAYPNVAYCVAENHLHYNKENPTDYGKEYLTFIALEDGTFTFKGTSYSTIGLFNVLSYSLDGAKTWIELSDNTNTPIVKSGNKIMWKGITEPRGLESGIGSFDSSGKFDVCGNIMSVLYGDDFYEKLSLAGKDYAFHGLFIYSKVVSAENLFLPATILSECCYKQMFYGCETLLKPPKLPATKLEACCYEYMFNFCKNLKTAPELPATDLGDSCYNGMFWGCESLILAPILPSQEPKEGSYYAMFQYCTSLEKVPGMMANIIPGYCCWNMFQGCTSLRYVKCLATNINAPASTHCWLNVTTNNGVFVKHPDMDDWTIGPSGIPEGWTIEDAVIS